MPEGGRKQERWIVENMEAENEGENVEREGGCMGRKKERKS